jgi:hypothetical protein
MRLNFSSLWMLLNAFRSLKSGWLFQLNCHVTGNACRVDVDLLEFLVTSMQSSMVADAGETDWDLAGTQFPRNCVPYNIIEF